MSDTQPDNATLILQINNLSIALPEGADRKYAVEEVSLTVNRGEVLCVVGESGSGKSVMTSAIMADIAPRLKVVKGEVLYNGNNVLEFSDAELNDMRGAAFDDLSGTHGCAEPCAQDWRAGGRGFLTPPSRDFRQRPP